MLTPEQITKLNIDAEELITETTDALLEDIIHSIMEAGKITNSTEYRIWLLKKFGLNNTKIEKELKKRLKTSEKDAESLVEEAAKSSYYSDAKILKKAVVPFTENKEVLQLLEGINKLNARYIDNLTGTIGFICPDNKFRTLTNAYKTASDYAFKMVSTGVLDYDTAIYNATRNLIDKGIRTIYYDSGVTTEVGAAVRRNVMSSIGNLTNEIAEMNHDTLGATGWEISAHAACAEDHEHIQGKQYTDKEFKALNESLKRPIGTLNCGHIAFPIIYGETEPVYTEKQLSSMHSSNHSGVYYEGKHYTTYEATQKQRQIERNIRTQKRKADGYKIIGNKEAEQNEKAKLQRLYSLYNNFSKKTGLKPQYSRFK